MAEENQLKLTNVRLSFPDIWKPKKIQADAEAKYGAQFLLDKKEHEDLIKEVKLVIWKAAKGKWGDDAKDMIKKGKLHVCLHEGSDKEYDGYNEHNMFISSSSPKRPLIVDRDRTPLAEDDRRPYAGCYVNAILRIWVQDNNFGKRINAELMGIQFSKDGEAFGAAPLSEDAFDNLEPDKGKNKGKGEKAEANGGGDDDDEAPF